MTELTQTPRPRPGLYTFHTDGASSGKRGSLAARPGIGAVLKYTDSHLVEAISKPIGRIEEQAVAEFRALVEGLEKAKRHGVDKIRVFIDSELPVRSVLNEVNLKSPELQELRSVS